MTQISTVHDNLVTLISTTLSDYTQIPNPYIPEESAGIFIEKGFGVAFGDGSNSNRTLDRRHSVIRNFIIALINQVAVTDHNVSGRTTLTKSLLEDEIKIISALEKEPTLTGAAARSTWTSDTGITFLEADRARYYLLEMNIEVEYFEDL